MEQISTGDKKRWWDGKQIKRKEGNELKEKELATVEKNGGW